MTQYLTLRAAEPQGLIFRHSSDFKRLSLFIFIALLVHIAAFWLAGVLRLNSILGAINFEIPKTGFLELTLEVNEPPAPLKTLEPSLLEQTLPPNLNEPKSAPMPSDNPPEAELIADNQISADSSVALPPLASGAALIAQGDLKRSDRGPDNTISLEETAPRFKSYNSTVRAAVSKHWLLPPAARSNFKPGRFTAVMTLSRQGEVLSIVVEESSGSPALDFAAMEALRGAAPYEPFPDELSHFSQLNFRLRFDYRAVLRKATDAARRLHN
ncbi:MAG: TonB family protein [Deltaproteobacteria bacterium]|jgi:TonB family protein|nr:TonB family protein [Deltaproteobacteria bacterium]